MKQTLLAVFCVIGFANANSQPLLPENSDKPVRLKDIVEAYKQGKYEMYGEGEEEEIAKGKYKKEGKDYFFERWYWYWSQHTDGNGYIIPTSKNYEEWKKYFDKNAQRKTTATNNSNWVFQGPTTSAGGYAGLGRINSIEFHPTDANTIYIASAGGGAWKTTNNGAGWAPISNMLPVLGTSDIDVNPKNPNILYLCTGDRDASDTYSIGVFRSNDGGASWNATGLSWTVTQSRLANCLVINKVDTASLTLASSNGIYKSYNSGATWTQVQTGNFKQVLYHPTDTNVLYAAGSGLLYRSANGGKTWTSISGFSGKGRIALAVTPADVKVVKAIVVTTSNGLDGIYNSTDTGKTFTKIYGPTGCNGDLISGDNKTAATSCGGQGWYDLCIAIDPSNVNKVIVGGVNTWYSTNGGTSWSIATQWWAQMTGVATVHADKHFMGFHPLVAGRLFQGCDGGVYRTDNAFVSPSTWTDMTNGTGITQFYRNAVSHTSGFVLGGAQDNGTKGWRYGTWTDENGGDGMDCQIDFVDSNTYYTATQNGSINRKSTNVGDANISGNIPGKPKGPWITPYVIHPLDHETLLAGYQKIYHSGDYGDTWDSVTAARLDATNDVLRIALTPAGTATIYAVVNSSNKVYFTHSWTPGNTATFTSITAPYSGYNISDIKIDHKNKDHFWVTFSGYGGPQVAEYKSATWTKINTNLPDVPVSCIEIDTSNNMMYIGTDIGVFYMDTVTKQWEAYNNNNAMPSIEVTDLGINYKRKELWASTYGRGMWMSKVPDTSKPNQVNNLALINADAFVVYPNPNNGSFTVKADATKFSNMYVTVNIYDYLGRKVWEAHTNFNYLGECNVTTFNLNKGNYIMEVENSNVVIGRRKIRIE
ncbi:MAG: T9SS type A sorting domain-containing protein [Bacteroidetes bacterium]|nr:T9SS type A sorting domain-containing protein [Bacteroidota bacterium]